MSFRLPILYTLFVFFNLSRINAQNLVPDPSFELIKKEPDVCQGGLVLGDNLNNYLMHWYTPTAGTADVRIGGIIKACPNRYIDWARTGSHLLGLETYLQDYTSPTPIEYREYAQTQLIQPLTVGRRYYAQMYVSVQWYNRPGETANSNNVGLLFTTDPVSLTGNTLGDARPILRTPQVNEVNLLTGANWMKVSGYFVADQVYQYLTIGNFFDNAHTLFTKKEVRQSLLSYYSIDDVLVVPAEQAPLTNSVDLGPDQTVCPGLILPFQLTDDPHLHYHWQDGSTSSTYIVTQPGIYIVTVDDGKATYSDTVTIHYPSPIKLPPDTTLCQGEVLTLAPNYPKHEFVWNTGSTDSVIVVSQAGQYWVSTRDGFCSVADTIHVQLIECPGSVPNVITPNQDGKNDFFTIDHIDTRPWRLEIYNRWGIGVFVSEPYHNEWTGEGLPVGVYYYELYCQPLRRRLKGWVTILR